MKNTTKLFAFAVAIVLATSFQACTPSADNTTVFFPPPAGTITQPTTDAPQPIIINILITKTIVTIPINNTGGTMTGYVPYVQIEANLLAGDTVTDVTINGNPFPVSSMTKPTLFNDNATTITVLIKSKMGGWSKPRIGNISN